jgi:uncharacterized protein YjbI with pentapeptide repeats
MSEVNKTSIFKNLLRRWQIAFSKSGLSMGVILGEMWLRRREQNSSSDPDSSWKRTTTILQLLTVLIGLAIISGIIGGYWLGWEWTGVGPSTETTITTRGIEVTKMVKEVGPKTVWDWLQLLFVPVVLGAATYWFRKTEQDIEKRREEQRAANERSLVEMRIQEERRVAAIKEEESVLQTYFDRMAELLLDDATRQSSVNIEARAIARARTLTVLNRLNSERKGSVIRFLYEAGLLAQKGEEKSFVDMTLANLSGAELMGANLRGASLARTNLTGANLAWANLAEADLSRTLLNEAVLVETNLNRVHFNNASLIKAHLMGAQMEQAILVDTDLTDADLGLGSRNDILGTFQTLLPVLGSIAQIATSFLTATTPWGLVGSIASSFVDGLSTSRQEKPGTAKSALLNRLRETAKTSSYLLENEVPPDSMFVQGANLQGADLTRAKLNRANLVGINLTGATVTEEQLAQARSYNDAIMPDGTIYKLDSPTVTSEQLLPATQPP